MTSPNPVASSFKGHYLLVDFRFGDPVNPTYAAFTNFTRSVSRDGLVYAAEPRIRIDYAEEIGVFDEKITRLFMPRGTFADRISNGEPHSRTFLRVREVFSTSTATEVRHAYAGVVLQAHRNPDGRRNTVLIEAVNIRSTYRARMGIVAQHHCGWTFGGRGCGVPKHSFDQVGSIAAVNASVVTIPGLTLQTPEHWRRGYIQKDGLKIDIRDWLPSTPDDFQLMMPPPADWLSAQVTVTPGCDREISTCRTEWDNESESLVIGIAMVAYNPLFESP